MSLDARYIVQYEGPFGENELEDHIKNLDAVEGSYGFVVLGYDTVMGETKHIPDNEIIKASGDPVQIMRREDGGFWKEIYSIKKK